jgi:hypothetical protein
MICNDEGMARLETPLLIAIASCSALHAGLCSRASEAPRHDFQFFAGFSPSSTVVSHAAPNRRLVVAGFSYSYHCWVWSSVSLNYTATAMPAAIVIQPDSHAVYGFGVTPLGFTFEPTCRRRLSPFLDTMEGMIASTEPIPENQTNATGLNFLFGAGGGVRWNFAPRRALTLGYRFLHISNANTTSYNPSLNSHVIYAGYSLSR